MMCTNFNKLGRGIKAQFFLYTLLTLYNYVFLDKILTNSDKISLKLIIFRYVVNSTLIGNLILNDKS